MRKILLFLTFLALTPLTLASGLLVLMQRQPPNSTQILSAQIQAPRQLYAALPQTVGTVEASIKTADARPVILDQYLAKHQSPMAPYADFLFEMSEKYGLDYRLMVAIAQCESNLCKKAPEGSYNCWGFENGNTRFLSWEQAIEQVAKTLKERYLDQGLVTPEQIMPKYAPPSVEKGGPWAKCVNQFFKELE